MTIDLPAPIQLYFASEHSGDLSGMEGCFAADAVVRDENRVFNGIDAIKAWRAEAAAKYDFTAEPVSAVVQDDKVVVKARVTGNFPGSPVVLAHTFHIVGDRIASLEIG